jgi:hypothetical protein
MLEKFEGVTYIYTPEARGVPGGQGRAGGGEGCAGGVWGVGWGAFRFAAVFAGFPPGFPFRFAVAGMIARCAPIRLLTGSLRSDNY